MKKEDPIYQGHGVSAYYNPKDGMHKLSLPSGKTLYRDSESLVELSKKGVEGLTEEFDVRDAYHNIDRDELEKISHAVRETVRNNSWILEDWVR